MKAADRLQKHVDVVFNMVGFLLLLLLCSVYHAFMDTRDLGPSSCTSVQLNI